MEIRENLNELEKTVLAELKGLEFWLEGKIIDRVTLKLEGGKIEGRCWHIEISFPIIFKIPERARKEVR